MLVFVDESGDTGLAIDKGSSKYFVVSLVLFEDNEEAEAADQRIELLKKELALPPTFEFHFHDNHPNIRKTFLKAIILSCVHGGTIIICGIFNLKWRPAYGKNV